MLRVKTPPWRRRPFENQGALIDEDDFQMWLKDEHIPTYSEGDITMAFDKDLDEMYPVQIGLVSLLASEVLCEFDPTYYDVAFSDYKEGFIEIHNTELFDAEYLDRETCVDEDEIISLYLEEKDARV